MLKVMVAPSTLREVKQAKFLDVLRPHPFELIYPKRAAQMIESEVIEQMPGIVYSLAGSEPYTRAALDKLPDLKVIARLGVGYDAVDVQAATERGIVVTIAPGINQSAVAEHCFMFMLAWAKNLRSNDNAIRNAQWPRHMTRPLRGQTLALLGLGRIGKAMTTRALAFEMNVIAYDPFPDVAFAEKHGVKLVTMDEAFQQGDIVSLHLPLLPETRGLINKRYFDMMKSTAYFINSARGEIVAEADLLSALETNRIAGAGLDVYHNEPPGDNPLTKLGNVLSTAHTAGIDTEALMGMAAKAAENIVLLHQAQWPAESVVNPEVREKFFAANR